jgi:hypothetical protein
VDEDAPKWFDRTAAIHQAIELFWDRGYEGNTFGDLIGAILGPQASKTIGWSEPVCFKQRHPR